MRQSNTRNQKNRRSQGSVVSHSSILIISAFLVGMAAGKASNPTLQMCLFLSGAFGFISYFGLGYLAQQRQASAVSRNKKRAAKKLELRMDRHIPRSASLAESGVEEQAAKAQCELVPAVGIQ
jgi:arginine exporter protein ArgO